MSDRVPRLVSSGRAAFRAGYGALSGQAALRAGYGAVLVLLVVASAEVYRIQAGVAERNLAIYASYLQKEELITEVRRAIWQLSAQARDFFLSAQPERSTRLRMQIKAFRAQTDLTLAKLRAGRAPLPEDRELRSRVDEFVRTIEPLTASTQVPPDRVYHFVQEEVVPRRVSIGLALRDLTEVSQQALRSRQSQFDQSRRAATHRVLLILAGCFALGVAVAWLSLRYAGALEAENAKRFLEVSRARQDLQHLSARLLEVQEEERTRLARELHDEVGQTLTALRIEVSHALAQAQVPASREHLGRARDIAERAVTSVRDISALLRPAILDDFGLCPAVQSHIEEFSRRSGIRATFVEEGVQDSLPDDVKTCIYRVVQEALHNCEKHSGAAAVNVNIRQTAREIVVTVTDDGKGISSDARRGCGILGMSERAARIGAVVALKSAEGQGTRVELTVPLANIAAAAGVR